MKIILQFIHEKYCVRYILFIICYSCLIYEFDWYEILYFVKWGLMNCYSWLKTIHKCRILKSIQYIETKFHHRQSTKHLYEIYIYLIPWIQVNKCSRYFLLKKLHKATSQKKCLLIFLPEQRLPELNDRCRPSIQSMRELKQ